MSWWARPSRTSTKLSLATLTLVWVCAVPAHAQTVSPCAVPDALVKAGLLAPAESDYQQLRAGAQPPLCAEAGLKAIRRERARRAAVLRQSVVRDGVAAGTAKKLAAAVRAGREASIPRTFKKQVEGEAGFAIARGLVRAGYRNAAADVVAARVAAQPDVEVPGDLRTLTEAGQHMAAARSLSRAGLDGPAKDELKAALQEDPTLAVPDELASPNRRRPFWQEKLGAFGPWVRTIGEIVIAGLALAALIFLAALGLGRGRSRLRLDSFSGGSEDARADTTVAVRENYGRLSAESGGRHLTLIKSSGEASAGPPKEVVETYPQAGVIAALIGYVDRLAPSRTWRVTGDLRPRDADRGVGLTVTFGRLRGRVLSEITVWEKDYGPVAPSRDGKPSQEGYDRLSIPIAAWLLFQAGERSLRQKLQPWSDYKVLGTKDWRSYALFAVGAEDQDAGRTASARRRYLRALERDPGNHGARCNLATAELRSASPSETVWKRATERLKELRSALEDGKYRSEPLWYRVRYNEAAAQLNRPSPGGEKDARQAAVDVCAELMTKLKDTDHWYTVRGSTKRLRKFLTDMRPAALVVLAAALQQERPPVPTPPDPQPVDEETLRTRLKAFANDEGAAAAFDQAVTHPRVIAYVVKKLRPTDVDSLYNLACYYAGVGRFADARARLLTAVELGGDRIGDAALADQSLAAYRADEERLAELEEVIQGVTEPEPGSTDDSPHKSVLARILEAAGV